MYMYLYIYIYILYIYIYLKQSKSVLKCLNNRDISVTMCNKGYNNLSKGERIAMKVLSDHTDIIITKADKGGAVVVMDVKDYINESHQPNRDHYKILNKDPTTTNAKLINETIQRLKNEKLLNKTIADDLRVSNPKTSKFYMQPKIHKKDNPGQPKVSSVNCPVSSISKYVDYYFQPIVKDTILCSRHQRISDKNNDIRNIPRKKIYL